MFINEYDILIDKILDDIFDNIDISKIDSKYLENNFNNTNKFIKNIDKLTTNKENIIKIEHITKLIIFAYIISVSFFNDDLNKIKTILIKNNLLKSEDLGMIISLNDNIITLTEILKEDNNEKLLLLYKKNVKYKNGIDILNGLGYEATMNLKGKTKKHKHNLIKVVIIDKYYRKLYRKNIFNLIYQNNGDEKILEIIVPKLKILDYSNVENILNTQEVHEGLAKEILDFYTEYEENTHLNDNMIFKISNLFSSKLVIPITDEFLRYHKITEKYEKNSTQIKKSDRENIKDQTKIRYIITKIEKLKDYYSKKSFNNKEILKEIEKLFYKSLIHRKAIIYNEMEELSIINKLVQQGKSAINSNEFYHDLLNLRKSSYINFKDFKKNGFIYDTRKTQKRTLTVVRYAGIESLEDKTLVSKNIKLETRTISKNENSKIVGILILDRNSNVNSLELKDLTDIRKINQNGYDSALEVLNNKINDKNDKNYYWIFDLAKDKFTQDTYEHDDVNIDLTNILMAKLYDFALNTIYNKIINKLNTYNKLDLYNSNYINNYYQDKFLKIKKYSQYDMNIKNKINNLLPIVTSVEDECENNIYGIIGKIYKLPEIKHVTKEVPVFIIPYKKDDDYIDLGEEISYCQHIIDWSYLSKMRSKDPNKHSEHIYGFIKKYVIQNDESEYICKSCKQYLDIQNYLANPYDGGTSGIDLILSTSQKLSEIKEYTKYSSLIKHMDKLVERLAQINNFVYYIGNDQIYKLRRQDIIKQVIDVINIHDKTLRVKNMNSRDREIKAFQKYGISSDFTLFFIFPLSNDIFVTTSAETDKYKNMKRNNIIAYILFFMILDLNDSQVNMFEFNKTCNYLLFTKFKNMIFKNLKLKFNNSDDVMNITSLNTMCYILYYTSCMISKYNIWYTLETVDKNISITQRQIIHTIVDLTNSLMEVYASDNKNYLYEILASKVINKINTLFKNDDILKTIELRENKKLIINNTTNKIQILKNSIKSILIPEFTIFKDTITQYKFKYNLYEINLKMQMRDTNSILKNDINEINKKYVKNNLIQLARIYNDKGIIRRFKITEEEASKFDSKYYTNMLKYIEIEKNNKKKLIKVDNTFNKLKQKYNNISLSKNSLDKILNEIKISAGDDITIYKKIYNIRSSKFELNHDYLGNPLQKSLYLMTNDDKVIIKTENKIKIYEIYDAHNDVKLIFRFNTLHYMGYTLSSKKHIDMSSLGIYINYIPSISEMLETLGFKKNIYSFNSKKDLTNELRNSINNLKDYIRQFKVFISKISYRLNSSTSHPILKYYMNKIDVINIKQDNITVFEDMELMLKFEIIKINDVIDLVNITKYDMIKLTASYNKLTEYLYSQLLLLIQLNSNKYIKLHIIMMILSLTSYFHNINFSQYTQFDLIRYNYIIDMELLQEVRDSVVEEFSDTVLENANNLLTEDEKEIAENNNLDNDEWSFDDAFETGQEAFEIDQEDEVEG